MRRFFMHASPPSSQRDAVCVPQEETSPFRPAGNSLSGWHLTHTDLLCFSYYIFLHVLQRPHHITTETPCQVFIFFIT